MRYYLLSTLLLLYFTGSIAQTTTLYQNDFELNANEWLRQGTLSPNTWIYKTCAGNGPSAAGNGAMYVSNPGASAGCGVTGNIRYGYTNASLPSESNIVYVQVDATCANNLNAVFDYKIEGNSGEDFAELVYSTDNGVSWVVLGGEYVNQVMFTNTSVALPSTLDNSNFLIGFRFTYSDATIHGDPFAFDNFKITGTDLTNPIISCVTTNVPAYSSSNCDVVLADYTDQYLSLSDNCSVLASIDVTQDLIIGSTQSWAVGSTHTLQLTATDEAGNFATCNVTLEVIDTVKPQIACPGNQQVYADVNCFYALPDYTGLLTYSDNCTATPSLLLSANATPGTTLSGNHTLIFTVEDASSNTKTCSFSVLALDTIKPLITCPQTDTLTADANCQYALGDYRSIPNLASDNCTSDINLIFSQDPIPNSILDAGLHTVLLQVMDESSNSKTCAFSVLVKDKTIPNITCPSPQDVYSDANCNGILGDYRSVAVVSDNCSSTSDLVVTQNPPFGTAISATEIITLMVTDTSGNFTGCTFLANLVDTLAPTLTCPNAATVAINSQCEYTVPDLGGQISMSDNCTAFGNLVYQQIPSSGSLSSGTTIIIHSVTDQAGNDKVCLTTLTPIDTDIPTVTCPSNQIINAGTNCTELMTDFTALVTVIDNCPGSTIVQTPNTGVSLPTGNHPVIMMVLDDGGNTASCTFQVQIIENELPQITCPSDISQCDPTVNYTAPIFSDNCLVSLQQTDASGLTNGSLFPVGITALNYQAIDSSGNTATCSFQVEILPYPSDAVIAEDTVYLCDVNTHLLNADPIVSGTGTWSLSIGQGSINNPTANNTGVNNLGQGMNVFYWTVTTPTCGTKRDSIYINVNAQPLPASTQDSLISCDVTYINLLSNSPSNGLGTWTTNLNAQIINVNSPNTAAIVTTGGWNDFIWTISALGCPSTSDTFHVYVTPRAVINEKDTTVCLENTNLIFTGNDPGQNAASWHLISGTAQLSATNNDTTILYNLQQGIIMLVYQMDNPHCIASKDTVTITAKICEEVGHELPNLITPNLDGKNDVFNINHLELLHPNLEVVIFNRWGSVVFDSIGYDEPWDGTQNGQKLPMGTYFYRINLNDADQRVLKGSITLIP